jgi:hypothetical protein
MNSSAHVVDKRASQQGAHARRERLRASDTHDEQTLAITTTVAAVTHDDELRDRQFAAIADLLRMAVELRSKRAR